jgi:hypothetical protein
MIPPKHLIWTPQIDIYWIPPVFLFSDLWAEIEEAISPLEVLCYLQFLHASGSTFAKRADQKMCGMLSSLPHPGHLRGLDRQSPVS